MKKALSIALCILITILAGACTSNFNESDTATANTTTLTPNVTTIITSTDTTDTPTTQLPATTQAVTTTAPTDSAATGTQTTEVSVQTRPQTDLSDFIPGNNTLVYTVCDATLYCTTSENDIAISADKTLICIGETADYAVILYRSEYYIIESSHITSEKPQSATALELQNGGTYYPAGEELVVIDAGHQIKGMNDLEPLGPGSEEMKKMLSSGTQGKVTRIPEYELNLAVAMILRDELISRGYSVVMIRETNNAPISNVQRATIANAYGGVFIRIHANGSEDINDRGAFCIYQTKNNPYNKELYPESKLLSECIIGEFCESTGILKLDNWATDTMTGINWCETPVTIIEMGYMSNAEEDQLMATDEFRQNAAVGIANGIDLYYNNAD